MSQPSNPAVDSKNAATILVMGATGVGKSTFVNLASDSDLRVSDSLVSCTDKIQLSRSFNVNGCTVTLVDTPGFDDTDKSDSEIFKIVCDFVASEYAQGRLLRGVIYLHRISDNRVSGTSLRNLRCYQDLCGPETIANSIIVTTMWTRVEAAKAAAYEEELKSKPQFFKTTLDQGAVLVRHTDTKESAHEIIRLLLNKESKPLRIQRELVDENKKPFQTAAGEALLRELAKLEQKHHKEMQELEKDLAEARQEQDEVGVAELQEEREKLDEEHKKLEAEKEKLMQLQLSFVDLSRKAGLPPVSTTTAMTVPSAAPQLTLNIGSANASANGNGTGTKPAPALASESTEATVNGGGGEAGDAAAVEHAKHSSENIGIIQGCLAGLRSLFCMGSKSVDVAN